MPIDREAALKQAEKLLRQGKLEGAIAEYVRLVEDQPKDWNAINALGDLYARAGDNDRAAAQYVRIADYLFAEGFLPKAAALYKKALRVKATDEHTLAQLGEIAVRQGLFADAKAYFQRLGDERRARGAHRGAAEIVARLSAAAPDDNPDLLLGLARLEAEQGRDVRPTLTRALALASSRYPDVLAFCDELAAAGKIEQAYGCVDMLVDVALLDARADRAIAALQQFLRHGPHVPALVRLVEVCVDADAHEPMRLAQAALCDAYLDDGHAAEARVIAEDLLQAEPGAEAHLQRLRRALDALGVEDPDRIIVAFLPSSDGDLDDIAPRVPVASSGDADEIIELDLSDLLGDLAQAADGAATLEDMGGAAADPDPALQLQPPKPLDQVFEEMRSRVTAQDQQVAGASHQYQLGIEHVRDGRICEGLRELQAAARVPLYRFAAASSLGRLYRQRGELQEAVEWLERAAEAPAPTHEEGYALLYELADTLEQVGESARALAVLIELEADAGDYRDVRARVDGLSRAQHGGPPA